ncbi:RNA helicase [Synechococcus sp. PCC 7336]|uniref:DEAD/DEAH box helicase n=1 Tax=Synechococcus sp. PCC 7336 TaxID=195250 RepID=UPI00034948CE|nr:DEAD/DEAH box helicase [Synechococcus sp. PCC 7336]
MTSAVTPSLQELFPFELDDFQTEAIAALDRNQSVVVCAPTGSGKTLVGEYAIYRAMSLGRRVFYTTPLKALSNQKFRDFGQQFGVENVGLLTGDVSINRDAPVVVMTTEIFRNMLYGTAIGEVGTSLEGVQAVILDECHYMNDRQRGTVWEESIVYCPPSIQLAALSATVANSGQLTDWLNAVHGPTVLVDSDYRPVPLEFSFVNSKGMFPLLEEKDGKIVGNSRLKTRRPQKLQRRDQRPQGPDIARVVEHLRSRDMLPAIYFIFSRRGCDSAIATLGDADLLTSATEREALKAQIDRFCRETPEAIRTQQLEPLYRGIAAHHAGILPAWKALIEALFQQGLIKIVFATETLAAGINMPARTTVISSLSKRTDDGHRLLTASEFLQMSGRAGRRGKDEIGYVVTVQSPFEGAREAAYLATSEADPLVSQFTPSYGMVLNLLQTHSLERTKELIERSFGQYLLSLQALPQQVEVQSLQAELDKIDNALEGITEAHLQDYQKLQGRLREERRILKYLKKHSESTDAPELLAQQERLEAVYTQMNANPVSRFPKPVKLIRMQEKRQRLERKLQQQSKATGRPQQQRWLEFLALADVLTEFKHLQDYKPNMMGEIAAAIRGDNELWLALALESGRLDDLDPHHLAGAIAALITEKPRSGTFTRFHTSDIVEDVLYALRRVRRRLFRTQREHQVFMPVWLEYKLAGLVEQWTLGVTWEALTAGTNLDEGDLVRLLRRTLDLLSQIPHIPHIPGEIKDNARRAAIAIDRFPISEVL